MNENENQDMIMLDFDELIQFIHEKTGYQKEMIENVLNYETEYMEQIGIASIPEDI